MLFYIIILLIIIILFIAFKNKEGFDTYKYTAIIVEPREHPALEFVLQNFNDNLSDEWSFVMFHGNKNIEYTKNICNKIFKKGRIKLVHINTDNLTSSEYSELFYNNIIYDNIPTEIFLVFQTDSIICKKHKHLINDFLKYDYVGAPWPEGNLGNGGLSLRKKSKMLKVLENCNKNSNNNLFIEEENRFEHEDRIFANDVDRCKPYIDIKKPDYDLSKQFSIEMIYNDKSFGVHRAYDYLDTDSQKKLEGWCPEFIELRRLNKLK